MLEASTNKYISYNTKRIYTPGELEYYDSLSFRFEKNVEIILSLFRGLETYLFSKSSDTFRDRLLAIQKLHLIDKIDFWFEARLLRNKMAYAYSYLPKQLKDIYEEIIKKMSSIFESMGKIE